MSIVTLDFETYYSKEFSLSRITTEEYVNDDRFEVIGVGIQIDDGEPTWYPGDKAGAALTALDWTEHAVLCHNTMFDGAILAWRYGIVPAFYFDTLCMARAIHGVEAGGSLKALAERYNIGEKGDEVINALGKRLADFSADDLDKYGAYCRNDVALTRRLFDILSRDFPEAELKLIDLTLRMYTQPVLRVDDALLVDRLEKVRESKQIMLASLKEKLACADEEEVRKKLASNKQFAEILTGLGVEVPKKVSAATGKEAPALAKNDTGFIALTEHEDPLVQQLCAVRLGTKSTLEESRIERFIDIGARNKARMPIPLKYYGAHTGRWSGCLVADSEVCVYNISTGVITKRIVDVLADDLVWDGEAFVPHDGVKFSGFSEVITWDGITGTEDHVVYTDAGALSLRKAMQGTHAITSARSPEAHDVDAAEQYSREHERKDRLSLSVRQTKRSEGAGTDRRKK